MKFLDPKDEREMVSRFRKQALEELSQPQARTVRTGARAAALRRTGVHRRPERAGQEDDSGDIQARSRNHFGLSTAQDVERDCTPSFRWRGRFRRSCGTAGQGDGQGNRVKGSKRPGGIECTRTNRKSRRQCWLPLIPESMDAQRSMDELEELAKSAGAKVMGRVIQKKGLSRPGDP